MSFIAVVLEPFPGSWLKGRRHALLKLVEHAGVEHHVFVGVLVPGGEDQHVEFAAHDRDQLAGGRAAAIAHLGVWVDCGALEGRVRVNVARVFGIRRPEAFGLGGIAGTVEHAGLHRFGQITHSVDAWIGTENLGAVVGCPFVAVIAQGLNGCLFGAVPGSWSCF